MARRLLKIALSTAVAGAFALGIVALFAPAPAHAAFGGCICPMVYAPVICSNGRTYSNACVASCNKAKNCVPTGNI
jgi:hypothetical protein